MSTDLEQQLRDDIREEADAFEPSPDLERRINRRVDRRAGQTRILAAAAISLAVLGVATVGLAAAGQDERESIDMVDDDRDPDPTTTPSTTEPTEQTTSTTAPTTTSTPDAPPTPSEELDEELDEAHTPYEVWDGVPLNRRGVGPIVAGMTTFNVELIAGVVISVDPVSWDRFGRTCGVFTSEMSAHQYVAMTPGLVPGDPSEAVIVAIGGSAPTITTEEGIHPGSTADEVRATYGEPTSVDPDAYGGQVLVFEQDGFAYGFEVYDGVVTDVRSGHVTGFAEFEPCA